MIVITLSNGKKVGNFSSPHPFTFEDGNVLPAVSDEEAERLKVEFMEEIARESLRGIDIRLTFDLSSNVQLEMLKWDNLFDQELVDIVFCPLPMIVVLRQKYGEEWLLYSPFRAIRMEDRIKKLISITKQCI